jgi:hypothetical protein
MHVSPARSTARSVAATLAPLAPARLVALWGPDVNAAATSLAPRPADAGANVVFAEARIFFSAKSKLLASEFFRRCSSTRLPMRCVVDGARAFITSANLTGHALEKNMEVGVLINGGPVPKTLGDHLQALIDVRGLDRV